MLRYLKLVEARIMVRRLAPGQTFLGRRSDKKSGAHAQAPVALKYPSITRRVVVSTDFIRCLAPLNGAGRRQRAFFRHGIGIALLDIQFASHPLDHLTGAYI
jgi:hypothetical protein